MSDLFAAQRAFAKEKDEKDPLRKFRSEFFFPQVNGKDVIYFCGNSLGLQPKNAAAAVNQELNDWKKFGISGFTRAKHPWLYYQAAFAEPLSRIVGCMPQEVTVMNTLTVNLHLMMLSFYKPTTGRFRILMEEGAFPSDQYAVETQVKLHGFDPVEAIVEVGPRHGEKHIHDEDIIEAIESHKDSLALVLIGGINYYSGQLFNMQSITAAAHSVGAIAGFDLAHAAGNVILQLHDWGVDFAAWCSYKYLNGGPGAAGAVFIHEKHAQLTGMDRAAGWWGNDEKTRFRMEKSFVAKPDASGWNISTAQVMNMVCLKASLKWFEQAGIENLRKKSLELTAWLDNLLTLPDNIQFSVITPKEPNRRGAQLSLYFPDNGRLIHQKMSEAGIVVDYREPGVIRVAPAPMYNSFEDVFEFFQILKDFR